MIMPLDRSLQPGADPPSPRAILLAIEQLWQQASRPTKAAAQEAQYLIWDSWEAASEEEELEAILKAIELDPTNPDALLAVASRLQLTPEDRIEFLRKIVALGAKKLGAKIFKNTIGHFWGSMATRPYMRARDELAEALRSAGRLHEAIAEWESMLVLNRHDNQGVRYSLLPCYLALRQLDSARRLLEEYGGDCHAVIAWGTVLYWFLAGDLKRAARARKIARHQNRYTEAYITGQKRLPKLTPDYYQIGSRDEAICYAKVLRMAWRKHPPALHWLRQSRS